MVHDPCHTLLRFAEAVTQRYSVRKGVLRNFAKFTGKHLCQSLFFNEVASAACNFIKKETLAQVFSCEFCEISKNNVFTEHLCTTAVYISGRYVINVYVSGDCVIFVLFSCFIYVTFVTI